MTDDTATTRHVVEEYFAKMAAGDARGAFALMSPEVRYSVIGSTPISTEATGVREVVDKLIRPFTSRLEGGAIQLILDEVIAEGSRAVALVHSEAMGRAGLPYRNVYAMVFLVGDGHIEELVEYLDTALVETAVFGKKLVEA
ncbi:MAG: nuclear transport factor 2 family protein [Dehalococcoidia bacterium]